VYTMGHKVKVQNLFVKYKKHMEKHIGNKIKVLHSDNGSEYTTDPFLQPCRDEGIERHFTVRKNRKKIGWPRG